MLVEREVARWVLFPSPFSCADLSTPLVTLCTELWRGAHFTSQRASFRSQSRGRAAAKRFAGPGAGLRVLLSQASGVLVAAEPTRDVAEDLFQDA